MCRTLMKIGCFDEIFFHGKPVLVGVEPHSMAWVLGQHVADRSGATWKNALQGFDALEQAVAADAPGVGRWLAAALVQTEYCRKLDANWEEPYRRVAAVLWHTVRASSAVECMNSVLRMHQGRHRTVTQPMLDLKRLYWNCRPFRSGKRRTRSPYELLGLALPTTDWWQLLHTPPADSA